VAIPLEFDVWQFVRLMDMLENSKRPRTSVYYAWKSEWTELDARLGKLATSDPDAYSALMMDQQIIVECKDVPQVVEVIGFAERVVRRLGKELAAKPKDKHLRDSLLFEKREMEDLLARLRAARRRPK